jgi:hypothetical protein
MPELLCEHLEAQWRQRFGSLIKGGTSLISMVPMVGMAAGMAGMIAGQAASVAAGAAMSSSIKAKDDVSFEYRLMPAGATQALIAKVEQIEGDGRRRGCHYSFSRGPRRSDAHGCQE